MIEEVLLLLVSLVILIKGADFFVKSASSIARKLGASEFVIGLTIVSIGTSFPELASSITASMKHATGIVIGNVVGSNITNIALIAGITAVITAVKTHEKMLKRDGYIMFLALIIFCLMSLNGFISRLEGLILLLFYIAYIMYIFETRPQYSGESHLTQFVKYFFRFGYFTSIKDRLLGGVRSYRNNRHHKDYDGLWKDGIILMISLTALVIGAKYFIEKAIFFADIFNLSGNIIGISLVALGTSFPELIVTISAVRNGFGDIAIGNVIGSNIANIFLVLGVSGMIYPMMLTSLTMYLIIPFMILISILFLIFIRFDWELNRMEGITFITVYIIFMIVLFKMNM